MAPRALAVRLVALAAFFAVALPLTASAQHSVAREWNEQLLDGIRGDLARPTVHARNLFHVSTVMYDAWAAYEPGATPWLLGRTVGNFTAPFYGMPEPADRHAAQEEAISYAAYRLLRERFANSQTAAATLARFDELFIDELGYDPSFTSTDYRDGSAAALGNYIARSMIEFGLQDGANEANGYKNRYYEPINPPLRPIEPGNPDLVDPNRWQPLELQVFIGQSGFISSPAFLSPEWGEVIPFSLDDGHKATYPREGYAYEVYNDPGAPPYLGPAGTDPESEEYKWTFALVAAWSGHLDPSDGVMWDISPGASGNIPLSELPTDLAAYHDFYDLEDGGDPGTGRALNPYTGMPYAPNLVPRGDYTRVLAEFWADGPSSETPPGHWFTILNYVHDHPAFERRFRGTGPVLDDLEWDVKAYFALGGAMHDVAICAWGVKGYYDYIRPVSAIRYMADRGQSSDPMGPGYDPHGIPLVPGAIEVVLAGDPLAGPGDVNVGKIKLWAWRGPTVITDPETDEAGVDWILAEDWWPYQRPTFVTPPFAGYISGHSTYSRAAAELMTLLTGDEYFPGGMGEFFAPQNEFLVFEEGPSVDVTLQWATYSDASDQTSLSRIWGGIHPPADDIPGRLIGATLGVEAFEYAEKFFQGQVDPPLNVATLRTYPNPVSPRGVVTLEINRTTEALTASLYDITGRKVRGESPPYSSGRFVAWEVGNLNPGVYFLRVDGDGWDAAKKIVVADPR
jgi:hypothetical protein